MRDTPISSAGLCLTPNALAAADVSAEAKKFMVVMNAATSIITTKSPYMARTSLDHAATQLHARHLGGQARASRRVYTMVSDYGPGIDAEAWFQKGFKDAGGKIVGSVRFPVANPDFSAFVQRAKDTNPDAIYIWIPGGAQPAAVGKALAERGIDTSKTKILGQDALTERERAQEHGRRGIGIITVARLRLQSPVADEPGLRQGL